MRNRIASYWLVLMAAALPFAPHGRVWADEVPVNLAPRAKVSASSEFDEAFRAEMAVSGIVPSAFQQDQDWAVRATQNGFFVLIWDKPVEAAQIVYYARVTSPLLECFKDYKVYLNGAGHNVLEIAPRRWGSPASLLAEIIRTGHPDAEGKPRVNVPDEDRRRVYLWLDLNVPYYGTSSSNHKARLGSRRMLPLNLDSTLREVAARRCVSCHQAGIPRKFYTRVMHPEHNNFLLAPLASAAGGTQKCGPPVFQSTSDPDYQKILKTFAPIHALLKARPRADMAGFTLMCD